jgi:hypothetical protein
MIIYKKPTQHKTPQEPAATPPTTSIDRTQLKHTNTSENTNTTTN